VNEQTLAKGVSTNLMMTTIYLNTHFKSEENINDWPNEFTIITAYATTGEHWSKQQNKAADSALEGKLKEHFDWVKRVTGYSPQTGHSEPGWAVNSDWPKACDLGVQFKQDAIYYVSKNILTVSYCDERRKKVYVGKFLERLTHFGK
jgi:hypothetical protein